MNNKLQSCSFEFSIFCSFNYQYFYIYSLSQRTNLFKRIFLSAVYLSLCMLHIYAQHDSKSAQKPECLIKNWQNKKNKIPLQ